MDKVTKWKDTQRNAIANYLRMIARDGQAVMHDGTTGHISREDTIYLENLANAIDNN